MNVKMNARNVIKNISSSLAVILAVTGILGMLSGAALADNAGQEHGGGGRMGGGGTAALTDAQQSVVDATKDKFEILTYTDEETQTDLEYALYIPEDYDASQSYPLIMYIPDSSASGKSAEEILAGYYGSDIWASDAEQAKHACFVFVPAFSETVVDDSWNTSGQIDTAVKILADLQQTYSIDAGRIYTTGQSMGCMTSLYLNSQYPDLFAASLFVSGQWDISVLKPLENEKFFYITCSGDSKASGGQTEVMEMLDADGIAYSSVMDMDPDATTEEKTAVVEGMLANNTDKNFIRFTGLDHMSSFNYAYDLESVRDWLFEQSR